MADEPEIIVELPGSKALFTTRVGGVSKPPYDTLNLAFMTDDDPGNVRRNRELLAQRAGVALVNGIQVHGNHVRVVREPDPDANGSPPPGDGLATDAEGLGLLVLAADCLPIAIGGGGAVAMVHAGWQGLASDVIAAAVAAVRRLAPANARLGAAIGPGAGRCCYEVGDDLHARFAQRGEDRRNGRNLDLKAIAAAQLRGAGVADVDDTGLCTICGGPELFFSHRRERGLTGRQGGVAWLT